MKQVSQAKVYEFDVGRFWHFVWQHDIFWLNVEKIVMLETMSLKMFCSTIWNIDVTKYTYLEVKVGNVFAVYEFQSLQYLLHEFNGLSFQKVLFLSNEVKQLPSTDTEQKSVLMRHLLHILFFSCTEQDRVANIFSPTMVSFPSVIGYGGGGKDLH